MANTYITSTQEQGTFVPEIWLQIALGRLKSYLTIQKCITKDTDLSPNAFASVGDTLHLPKRGSLTVNDKTENLNYTVQQPQGSKIDLVLNKHKEVTFGVESRAISTMNQDIISGYVTDAAIAIAEQIDTDLFSVYSSVSGGNTITNASTMTEANILSARKIMVDNKVHAMDQKFLIIATSQTNALLQIDRLVRYDSLGISNDIPDSMVGRPTRFMEASIGRVHTFEVCESQLVPTASSPLVAQNLFFSRDGILFSSRPLENPDSAYGVSASVITDPDSGIALRLLHWYNGAAGAHQITLDVLYGFTLMRTEHVGLIKTSA